MLVMSMPSISDATDFGLSDESKNKAFLNTLTKPKLVQVISSNLALFRSGTKTHGYYFVVNSDKDLITYLMEYNTKQLKKSVAQVRLWRSLVYNGSLPKGFASNMVFSVLLPEYHRVISDSIQTLDGRRFWIDLIGTALHRGLTVSLVNTDNKISVQIKDADDLVKWAQPGSFSSAWGMSEDYAKYRFLIEQ